ncbi:MAG TPA: hypothetical protein VF134_05960 [Candidatus Dormibacteraeota bacterium]
MAGAMAATMAGFLLGLAFGFGLPAIILGLAAALAASAPGWWRARSSLVGELVAWRPPWVLLGLLAICWTFTVYALAGAYVTTDRALMVWGIGVYSDWAAHLTYAGSFAYAANLPPEYPIDPGHPLGYPFLVDYLAAELVPLGAPLTASLVLTSGYLGLALPGVMYLAGRRLLSSTVAPALGVLTFGLGGGLGFTQLPAEIDAHGLGALVHVTRLYTQIPNQNYQWLNPVLAYLLPQRSILFGLAVAFMVAALLWLAVREPAGAWRPFLAAGVLTGAAPLFHVHGYGTAVALGAFWALLNRRREWVAFFLPALGLGLPVVLWMVAPGAHELRWQVGWLAAADGAHDNWVWFWLKNTGLFIPLLLVAQFWRPLSWGRTPRPPVPWGRTPRPPVPWGRTPRPPVPWGRTPRPPVPWGSTPRPPVPWGRTPRPPVPWGSTPRPPVLPPGLALHLAPLWLWFVAPNLAVFQPWDWDNTKFFVFWYAFGSLLVGALLVRLGGRRAEGLLLAGALGIVLGLSGFLDLEHAFDPTIDRYQFTDASGLRVAQWARTQTPPKSIFLVAPEHNQPVPTLGGRRVAAGYAGWLWTYGLPDWVQRTNDAEAMLKGDPQTEALLRRYHVAYVVVGPQEEALGARQEYWAAQGQAVFSSGSYTVYAIG